jgi:hypothetical protein
MAASGCGQWGNPLLRRFRIGIHVEGSSILSETAYQWPFPYVTHACRKPTKIYEIVNYDKFPKFFIHKNDSHGYISSLSCEVITWAPEKISLFRIGCYSGIGNHRNQDENAKRASFASA